MGVIKRLIFYSFLIIVILLSRNYVIEIVTERFLFEGEVDPPINNSYSLPRNASSFANNHYTESFYAKEKDDLMKIIFTTTNSGQPKYSFYCATEYEECFVDLKNITDDAQTLSHINNFVHPYNSFHHINVQYDSQRKIDLTVSRLYSRQEIDDINAAVNKLWSENITTDMSQREKLKTIHDAILYNSEYDRERAAAILNETDYYDTKNVSHKANGPLIVGKSICGGYSDAMALFLYRMNIPNYRISNDQHIWNLIYIEDKWLHLDLTWNNPSTNNKQSIIISTYFLITSKQLENLRDGAHEYDKNIFIEAK